MKEYTKPEFKKIEFEVENVITASSPEPTIEPGPGGLPVISPRGNVTD